MTTDVEPEKVEKLDLSQFDDVAKGSKSKNRAKQAFKRHKAGLKISDYEKDLIAIYYPWVCE